MSLSFNPTEDEIRSLLYTECRNLEFLSKKWADDKIAGAYKSLQKGSGIEFEEARLYIPGDDARRIDWKVSARKQDPYVKSFREEKDQSLLLMVDVSPSTLLGINKPKIKKIAEIAAFLSTIALKNGDNVGCLTFSKEIKTYIPPQKGLASTFRLLHRIFTDASQSNRTQSDFKHSFTSVINSARKVFKKKSMVFLISDFNFEPDFKKSLGSFSKKHDVYAIRVLDDIETNIPETGVYSVVSPETGHSCLIDFSNKRNRKEIMNQNLKHQNNLKNCFAHSKVPFITIKETDSIQESLNAFFQKRSFISGI